MSKVFISYIRQSEAIARNLANDIEALGHTAWFDQELSGGQIWWDQILATIRNCDVFVFVLDSEAMNSSACKSEYGYAADLGKSILPVLVSEGVSTKLLPPALSQIQFVDYRKRDRDAVLRLARAFTTVPPPNPLPDPLPPPPEVPLSYLGSLSEQVEATSILSYEKQSALVVDLRRSLRDIEAADDTRTLLERLRKRRDLFATVAEEIDELLRNTRKASSAPFRTFEQEPPPGDLSQKAPSSGHPPRSVMATVTTSDKRKMLLATLLVTIGWSVILLVSGSIAHAGGSVIGLLFIGVIGGLINALALQLMHPSITRKQVLLVTGGWAIPFFFCTFPIRGFGMPFGWGSAWAMAGLITGLVLRRVEPSVQGRQVLLISAGWIIGPIIDNFFSGVSMVSFFFYDYSIFYRNGLHLTLSGAFIGAVGGGGMLWQFSRATSAHNVTN